MSKGGVSFFSNHAQDVVKIKMRIVTLEEIKLYKEQDKSSWTKKVNNKN